MRKRATFSPYMKRPLVIYDFARNPSEFPYIWGVEGLNCKRRIPICRLFFKIYLLTHIEAFYSLEIYSIIGWYFQPSLWTVAPMDEGTILVYCCPSIFSLTSSPSSPLPKLNVHFIQTVCVWGGGRGGGEFCCVDQTIFCRNFTLCFWPDAEPTKLLHHPKQNDQWKRH